MCRSLFWYNIVLYGFYIRRVAIIRPAYSRAPVMRPASASTT